MSEGLCRPGRALALLFLLAAGAGFCQPRAGSIAAQAVFHHASVEYRAGNYSQARELYGRILIDYPQSGFMQDSLFYLAECDLALGDAASAEKRYSTMLSVYPGSAWEQAAEYRLGECALRENDPAAAVIHLERVVEKFPRGSFSGRAQLLKADILFDQKEYDKALAGYREALAVMPDGVEAQAARYSTALAELALGREAEAVLDFGRAARGADRDLGGKAELRRAVLLAVTGRQQEAISALIGFTDASTGGARTSTRTESALRLLASLLDQQGENAASVLRWDQLVKSYPGSASLAEYIFWRGAGLLKLGEPGALDDFQRIIRDYPESVFRNESEYSIGYLYARGGEYARALPYFQEAAQRAASSEIGERSLLAAGVCLYNARRYDRALVTLRALVTAYPGGETAGLASLYVGKTLYRMEAYAGAAQQLADAAAGFEAQPSTPERDPQAAEARFWLGWSLFRLGKLTESHDAFLSLARAQPGSMRATEAIYRAGVCEKMLGDDDAAALLFDEAAQRDAQGDARAAGVREQALYEEGWALIRLGKSDQGRGVFAELARSFPVGMLAPDAFFKLAAQAYDQGHYAEARSGYSELARRFPRSQLAVQAAYWSAESARQAGDAQGALDGFWALLSALPGESLLAAGQEGFSRALSELGSLEVARQFALKAGSTEGLDQRVRAGIQLDCAGMLLPTNPAEAITAAQEVQRAAPPEPYDGEANLLIGRCYAALGDEAKALDVFTALSDFRGDEVGAAATIERGHALESAGNSRDAINQYLRISAAFPGLADFAAEGLFHAARLSLQQGDREGSARISQALRSLYPGSPWAARVDGLRDATR